MATLSYHSFVGSRCLRLELFSPCVRFRDLHRLRFNDDNCLILVLALIDPHTQYKIIDTIPRRNFSAAARERSVFTKMPVGRDIAQSLQPLDPSSAEERAHQRTENKMEPRVETGTVNRWDLWRVTIDGYHMLCQMHKRARASICPGDYCECPKSNASEHGMTSSRLTSLGFT
jgi:hypothetical protein